MSQEGHKDLEMEMPPLGSIGIGQLIARIDRSWDTRERIREAVEAHRSSLQTRAARTHDLLVKLIRARQEHSAPAEMTRPL